MGWLFCSDTRRALIQHLTENKESETVKWETLKHCTKGHGLLWTVSRTTNKETERSETYIGCYLLRYSGGLWGYKDMCESMHPYQYSCPLSYLALAPVECEKWREGVRVYHEKAVKRRELKRAIRNHNKQVKEQHTMNQVKA